MNWPEVLRRMQAGEDIQDAIEAQSAIDREEFAAFLRKIGGDDAADLYLVKMREVDTGVHGARATWHSITATQRRVMSEIVAHGGTLSRVGKEYRHRDRHQPHRPVYVATLRPLCERELLAWDGGAFDPEASAVITERGRFVVAHRGLKCTT